MRPPGWCPWPRPARRWRGVRGQPTWLQRAWAPRRQVSAWGARKPLQVHFGAARVGGNRLHPAPPRELSFLTLRIAHLCHALRGRPGAARLRDLGPLHPAFQALTTFCPAATCWGHAACFSLGSSPTTALVRVGCPPLWNTHLAGFQGGCTSRDTGSCSCGAPGVRTGFRAAALAGVKGWPLAAWALFALPLVAKDTECHPPLSLRASSSLSLGSPLLLA